jgi:hypothetical protein
MQIFVIKRPYISAGSIYIIERKPISPYQIFWRDEDKTSGPCFLRGVHADRLRETSQAFWLDFLHHPEFLPTALCVDNEKILVDKQPGIWTQSSATSFVFKLLIAKQFYISTFNLECNKKPTLKSAKCLVLSSLVTITYSRAKHYHRPWSISLLSSKWDQVGQLQYNRHRKTQFRLYINKDK